MTDNVEVTQADVAKFFFEIGYGACWADAYIANGEKAPFPLSDAGIERAWDIAPEAVSDRAEFDRNLWLANRAQAEPSSAVDAKSMSIAWAILSEKVKDANRRGAGEIALDIRDASTILSLIASGSTASDGCKCGAFGIDPRCSMHGDGPASDDRPAASEAVATGWLIECQIDASLRYRMATRWDRDHAKALRFARKVDAEAFRAAHVVDESALDIRIVEHAWG